MLDSEISALLRRKSETAHLDYKAGFEWKKENRDHQLGLLRDMMGMANTQDGGTIVLGVEDVAYKLAGVSQAILTSFDQTDIGNQLHRYSEPKVQFELHKVKVDSYDLVVIRVFEFADVPIICTQSICGRDQTKPILRRGALYIRTPAAQTEEIASAHDMREFLGRAVQKRGDELLRLIESLIKGRPIAPTEEAVSRYAEEMAEADEGLARVLKEEFLKSPRWELVAYPTQYFPDRIRDLPMVERLVKDAQVELRGWPFPYIGHKGENHNFNLGYGGYVDSHGIREGFRLYKSGLLVFKRALWEDLRGLPTESSKRTLSFISAIYTLTEFVLFLSRLYQAIDGVDQIHLKVNLIGCQNRILISDNARVFLGDGLESHEDQISFARDFKVVELRAGAEEIARSIASHIFHVFNWTDVADETIAHHQKKILPRR